MENQDQVLQKILDTVGGIKETVDVLKEDVGIIKEKVEILEENAVTRKEFQQVLIPITNRLTTIEENMVTKQEFNDFKTKIYTHVDGFVKLHETLDQELVFLRHKYDGLDDRVTKIEQQMGFAGAA